ncbi:MAG: 16S rRNA (uracil(1498)-N(3))-methyltransferase, partial [Clostridiales bacterium]|nr:16S rRNA (uracil(1498)-N(3))-methyltransferase [Clostridiales bacterium]
MYQFFIKPENIQKNDICITEKQDVNHIRNVLRMRMGEKISLCCEENAHEYICSITALEPDHIRAAIEDINGASRELPVSITLFQGLPKGDKMELVIQKAVELGAARIVQMASKSSVVRLEANKAAKKVQSSKEIAK